MTRWIGSLFVGALLVASSGCGNPTTIRGTVTLNGDPVSEGSISFEPADGNGPSIGGTIRDGKFEIAPSSTMTPGKKSVRIRAAMKTGKQIPAGPPTPPGTMIDEMIYYPAKDDDDPKQEVEVVKGKANDFLFELKSTVKAP